MFNYLCKTIFHCRRATTASPFQNLHCFQSHTSIIFIKHISTTSNQHSFTVTYLINSCGFSQESALSASKRVHFESPEKPDTIIAFFKNRGFTNPQISKLIRFSPNLLVANPEKTLLPKLDFFYSKGLSKPEVAKIFYLCPKLFDRSLKNHIIPSFDYLSSDLFQSSERAIATIKRCPRILEDAETKILPNVNILRDYHVPESNIAMFLYNWPRVFQTNSSDRFKNIVETVNEMGFDPLKLPFVLAIVAKWVMSRTKWESKVNVYRKWGLSDEEILAAFGKDPWCMIASEDKITGVMDFFVNKIGWGSSIIARRPDLVKLSMEKRFIPRAAVLQFLLSNGLIKNKNFNSVSLFVYPEETFLERFVNSYKEAPQLLKIYKEKLDLSKITKGSA